MAERTDPGDAGFGGTAAAFDRVLITQELDRRLSRPPDHDEESRAYARLARALGAHPDGMLQTVVETARHLCHAGSAGVSILEPGGACGIFRWRAIAGAFAANLMGTLPREDSPCAEVITRNALVLLREPALAFPAIGAIEPHVHEALLAPWSVDGEPVGTIWLLAHRPDGAFDAEDARRLDRLAAFASAAWRTSLALAAARDGGAEVERRVQESTAALRQSRAHINHELRLCQTALATIEDFVFVFDLAGRLLLANKPLLEALSLERGQAIGKTLDDLPCPSGTAAKLRHQIRQVIQTRARLADEMILESPPGRVGRYERILSPILDPLGEVAGVAGSARRLTAGPRP